MMSVVVPKKKSNISNSPNIPPPKNDLREEIGIWLVVLSKLSFPAAGMPLMPPREESSFSLLERTASCSKLLSTSGVSVWSYMLSRYKKLKVILVDTTFKYNTFLKKSQKNWSFLTGKCMSWLYNDHYKGCIEWFLQFLLTNTTKAIKKSSHYESWELFWEERRYYHSTSTPIFLAVPAIALNAASLSFAFKSSFLSS